MKTKYMAGAAAILLTTCACTHTAADDREASRERAFDPDKNQSAILDQLNALRSDPSGYAEKLMSRRKYYHGKLLELPGETPIMTSEGVSALNGAVKDLRAAKPLPTLTLSAGLTKAARDHVEDIGPRGMLSHTGSNGSTPAQRDRRYVNGMHLTGECISFGPRDPESVVVSLVVDDGVPSRGHRELLLNPGFHKAGIACGPHKKFGWMCVIDLADSTNKAS